RKEPKQMAQRHSKERLPPQWRYIGRRTLRARALQPAPRARRTAIEVDEAIATPVVATDPAAPRDRLELLHDLFWALPFDANVDRLAERMLAVRRDVMALLAHHLVPLGAAVAGDELDSSPRVSGRDRAETCEEASIHRDAPLQASVFDERRE